MNETPRHRGGVKRPYRKPGGPFSDSGYPRGPLAFPNRNNACRYDLGELGLLTHNELDCGHENEDFYCGNRGSVSRSRRI